MSLHRTTVLLTNEDRKILDANSISLTKLVRNSLQKINEKNMELS